MKSSEFGSPVLLVGVYVKANRLLTNVDDVGALEGIFVGDPKGRGTPVGESVGGVVFKFDGPRFRTGARVGGSVENTVGTIVGGAVGRRYVGADVEPSVG